MCVRKECGHGEGAGPDDVLMTDTRRRVVSLAENAGRLSVVELREPRNLCVRESEERGHGEGVGVYVQDVTLLTDTRRRVVSLSENADRIPGFEL